MAKPPEEPLAPAGTGSAGATSIDLCESAGFAAAPSQSVGGPYRLDAGRIEALAREALDECRASLMMAFRFLDTALWRMPFEAAPSASALSTDGRTLFFDPVATLVRYRDSPDELLRDYLHLILHCVFRHPFDERHPHHEAWSLSCDVVVETIALEMCARRYASQGDAARREAASHLRLLAGSLVPLKLYRLFDRTLRSPQEASAVGLPAAQLREMALLFARDGHERWASNASSVGSQAPRETPAPTEFAQESDADEGEGAEPERAPSLSASESGDDEEPREPNPVQGDRSDSDEDSTDAPPSFDGEAGEETSEDAQDASAETTEASPDAGAGEGSFASGDGDTAADEDDTAEQAWKDEARQIEMDLATYSRAWGDEADALMANLALATRTTCNYADFLKRFCTMAEDLRVNDDEFDYIFYTYGLRLYGSMPLIEPLEYQETNRVREFVIAIDTSESCEGDLVRSFVSRTYEILKESEAFGDTVNVHIVQCDARVQADTKISSLEELETYRDDFWIRGLGGTDFRPVFSYVSDLIDKGEFEDLRGLVYFTDGLGTFPSEPPPYDAAFVFVDSEGTRRHVPPWAMKVVMDEDQIREL